ncbi:MAG TPA: EH signature domain-containing protein [Nitrospira sp.]|jgi:hypothetical protein|nr:EH signature domain-containing protein [Nitrospira sp.]
MLSGNDAVRSLEQALDSALASLHIPMVEFGRPAEIEKASKQAQIVFQGIATARPSRQDASAAVFSFMRGESLTDHQYDLAASALCEPFRELNNTCVVGDSRFDSLLNHYEFQAKSRNLWRLTWYGLLSSYFTFDMGKASDSEREGWIKLRNMLRRTWPDIDTDGAVAIVPDWIKVMRSESQLLTAAAVDKYSVSYLNGETESINRLAEDLGIPQTSWFWHSLVLGAVRKCCDFTCDTDFKARIPRLLELISTRPVFRDEALEILLERYHRSSSREPHPQLRDFVVHKNVWRNPKLKAAGMATAWNRVSEPVWRMVLGWVNEANLKLFFELLAGRSGSDEGRLEFWGRYLHQITWTRLVFGSETMELAHSNQEIRSLLAQEEGTYATLTLNKDVDAFMMQIGDYLAVEFSKKPNACYVYSTRQLRFDSNARRYAGSTGDLKYGFYDGAQLQIIHVLGWEQKAEDKLKSLGIYPDKHSIGGVGLVGGKLADRIGQPATSNNRHSIGAIQTDDAPKRAKFSIDNLRKLVSNYSEAHIKDYRTNGGRLWVEDSQQHASLCTALKRWDFRWSKSRNAWYYPED